jgi:hypothetical protein
MVAEKQVYKLACGFHLPYIRLPKTNKQYIFTLKMATPMFAEMFGNFQHSTLIPESRSCTQSILHTIFKFVQISTTVIKAWLQQLRISVRSDEHLIKLFLLPCTVQACGLYSRLT